MYSDPWGLIQSLITFEVRQLRGFLDRDAIKSVLPSPTWSSCYKAPFHATVLGELINAAVPKKKDHRVGFSWSPEVQLAMRVIQQIGVKIRPGITDLLQPTDTDFAMSLKASFKSAQAEKKKRMKETAAASGCPSSPVTYTIASWILSI